MLNEWIKKIDEIIQRLSMFIQIQTQEVITDLNKVKELLETPEEIKPVKANIKVDNTEIVIDKKDDWSIVISSEWNISIAETKEDIVKRYIDKFNKKPFAWWSEEVIKEKLGE